MSTDRVFRILESELNKNLAFTYTIVERQEPGTRRVIRAGQQFTIEVRVRNDASLTMTDVRGAIRPTAFASFEQTTFRLDRLPGGTTQTVARIRMTIDQAPERGYVFDELLSVTLNARADLSRFRFHDTNRQIRYAQSTSSLDGERPPLRTARVTVPERPGTIPLASDVSAPSRRPPARRRSRGAGFLRLRPAESQG